MVNKTKEQLIARLDKCINACCDIADELVALKNKIEKEG